MMGVMGGERMFLAVGFACLLIAVSTLVFGTPAAAIASFVFLALGAGLLFTGLVRTRVRSANDGPPAEAPARGERLAWIVAGVLAAMAPAAGVVAATVAVGEAIGHATGHLVTGLACLAIYVGLAALWHPQPGSGRASFRGMALLVLAIGAFGSFVESLGGAGYDAANLERRIPTLASLHDVGILLAPVALLAVPIGLATIVVIGAVGIARRVKPA
jgi:hypothetical protein